MNSDYEHLQTCFIRTILREWPGDQIARYLTGRTMTKQKRDDVLKRVAREMLENWPTREIRLYLHNTGRGFSDLLRPVLNGMRDESGRSI